MANIRFATPTCGAASPTPFLSSIVATNSRPNSSSLGPNSLSSTLSQTLDRIGSSQYRSGRMLSGVSLSASLGIKIEPLEGRAEQALDLLPPDRHPAWVSVKTRLALYFPESYDAERLVESPEPLVARVVLYIGVVPVARVLAEHMRQAEIFLDGLRDDLGAIGDARAGILRQLGGDEHHAPVALKHVQAARGVLTEIALVCECGNRHVPDHRFGRRLQPEHFQCDFGTSKSFEHVIPSIYSLRVIGQKRL